MKNVWKGLIIGALTGAGIGLIVDLLEALGRRSKQLSVDAREEASHLGTVAKAKIQDAELPDRALATAAQVSPGTVSLATQELEDAGLLRVHAMARRDDCGRIVQDINVYELLIPPCIRAVVERWRGSRIARGFRRGLTLSSTTRGGAPAGQLERQAPRTAAA